MIGTYSKKEPTESIPRALRRALHAANRSVLERAQQLRLDGEAGTTLAAAVVHENSLYWISVGDSRIYLYRGGALTQLTVDHDYARHLARKVVEGEMSEMSAERHPERHAITSFLGLDTLEEIDQSLKAFPLHPGDRILICTDGLYGVLADSEIARILGEHATGAAQALVDAVLSEGYGNQDNVTVALLDYASPAASSSSANSIRELQAGRKFPSMPRWFTRWPVRVAAALLLALAVGATAMLARDQTSLARLGNVGRQVSQYAEGVIATAKQRLQRGNTPDQPNTAGKGATPEVPAPEKGDTVSGTAQDTTPLPGAMPLVRPKALSPGTAP
jgi:protein phosphatase